MEMIRGITTPTSPGSMQDKNKDHPQLNESTDDTDSSHGNGITHKLRLVSGSVLAMK
jgi:hypothetical protein